MTDVLVIGAGPAGMSAAIELCKVGLTVTVADDQTAPGGRIFASIESRRPHGAEDRRGADLVAQFRFSGATYLPGAEIWEIEAGRRVFLTQNGRAQMLEPRFVLLASGAQERPMPFPGWELPGVMTIGAAQLLLKTARQIPDEPVWFAGSGPLLLLYAHQLLAAGGTVGGVLDTTPPRRLGAAVGHFPGALSYGWQDLIRGLSWQAQLQRLKTIKHVAALEAVGSDRLFSVRYTTRNGHHGEVQTNLLLVHDGVVPAVHTTMSAGCAHRWNPSQRCFEPKLNEFSASSHPTIFVAGDGGGINGARAAAISGRLAAIGIALAAERITITVAEGQAASLRNSLRAAMQFRRFLDTLYPPVALSIPDLTMVCRCEEVTAGQVREVLRGRPNLGPDGVKIATRAGMGPCQGRQCALTLTSLVEEAHGADPASVGHLRVRPPLKPLTLGELAALDATS